MRKVVVPPKPDAVERSFNGSFVGKTRDEMSVTFTVSKAKEMCWEDAKELNRMHGPEAFMAWGASMRAFCQGNELLQNCLMMMTATYLDFVAGLIDEKIAKETVWLEEKKLHEILYDQGEQQSFLDTRGKLKRA